METIVLKTRLYARCNNLTPRVLLKTFGVGWNVLVKIWKLMVAKKVSVMKAIGIRYHHLLWLLHFMRAYPLEEDLTRFCNADAKTVRRYIWLTLEIVHDVLNEVS